MAIERAACIVLDSWRAGKPESCCGHITDGASIWLHGTEIIRRVPGGVYFRTGPFRSASALSYVEAVQGRKLRLSQYEAPAPVGFDPDSTPHIFRLEYGVPMITRLRLYLGAAPWDGSWTYARTSCTLDEALRGWEEGLPVTSADLRPTEPNASARVLFFGPHAVLRRTDDISIEMAAPEALANLPDLWALLGKVYAGKIKHKTVYGQLCVYRDRNVWNGDWHLIEPEKLTPWALWMIERWHNNPEIVSGRR